MPSFRILSKGDCEDNLVIWGGEFGRTNCQGKFNGTNFGRIIIPEFLNLACRGGFNLSTYGQRRVLYSVAEGGVHVHDFTPILHLLGIDHERLTFQLSGSPFSPDRCALHAVKPIFLNAQPKATQI